MKISHIILIVVAVVAVAVVVTLTNDPRVYSDFKEAAAHPEKSYEIIGTLDTTAAIEYDAFKNPDAFSFYMFDQNNNRRKVVVSKPKPQDFEKSKQVVVGGHMKGDEFMANSILLKCPSKYESQGMPAQLQVKRRDVTQ